jgi:ribosomal protein L4
MMKKLVFALTLAAFAMSSSLAFAIDRNRDALRQAWAAIQEQEKKQAAADKAAAEKAKAPSSQTKSKNER